MAKKPTPTQKPKPPPKKVVVKEKPPVAVNRKARFEYVIEEVMEAGIVLLGTEVKSLRMGRANIADSYGSHKEGEIWLWNTDIPVYSHGNLNNHEPKRGRKLLLTAKQIKKLIGALKVKGTTLIPLEVYFNKRGYAKVKLAIAQGKKQFEKRDTIKQRDWARQKSRLLKK
jgi:SsrA-binding protein